jgi:hypothetical protein
MYFMFVSSRFTRRDWRVQGQVGAGDGFSTCRPRIRKRKYPADTNAPQLAVVKNQTICR